MDLFQIKISHIIKPYNLIISADHILLAFILYRMLYMKVYLRKYGQKERASLEMA